MNNVNAELLRRCRAVLMPRNQWRQLAQVQQSLEQYPLPITSAEQLQLLRGVQPELATRVFADAPPASDVEYDLPRLLHKLQKLSASLEGLLPAEVVPLKRKRSPKAPKAPAAKKIKVVVEPLRTLEGHFVCLVDCRETSLRDKNELREILMEQFASWCRSLALPLGDMVWAYECQQIMSDGTERTKHYLTPLILERKTQNDLYHSIQDSRYTDQVARLRSYRDNSGILTPIRISGMDEPVNLAPILLLEKAKHLDPRVNLKSVETATLKMQMRDRLAVLFSQSATHTCALLRSIHEMVVAAPVSGPTRRLSDVTTYEVRETVGENEDVGPPRRLSFNSSAKLYGKQHLATHGSMYAQQLRILPGLRPKDIPFITKECPTICSLIQKLEMQ